VSSEVGNSYAVIPRLPRISSLRPGLVHPIRRAKSAWLTPVGSRNSSRRISPGWKGFVGCSCIVLPPSSVGAAGPGNTPPQPQP